MINGVDAKDKVNENHLSGTGTKSPEGIITFTKSTKQDEEDW